MKAISLWQPWASAIVFGVKRVETRHWSTRHRGSLAIHAAKKWDTVCRDKADVMGMPELPLGKVVAVANLFEIYDLDLLGLFVTDQERAWGDYSPGRYGWLLTDIRALRRPFDYRGGQGIFNIPDDMVKDAQ